jgi:putative endonuclease
MNKHSYTASRLPVEMIYCEKFTDFSLAIQWENRIKDWSRKKKEALIAGKWDQLKIEAECKNDSSSKNAKKKPRTFSTPLELTNPQTE